jgi:hypothetical protein
MAVVLLGNLATSVVCFALYFVYSQRGESALGECRESSDGKRELVAETESEHYRSSMERIGILEDWVKARAEFTKELVHTTSVLRDSVQRLTTLQEITDKRVIRLEDHWMKEDSKKPNS